MPFGAEIAEDGSVRFRIFAPAEHRVELEIADRPELLRMKADGEGWHELVTSEARAGTRYRYVLADGMKVADPASRFQPEDVDGPSEVINPMGYGWADGDWKGRPWSESILYELHVGTFTEHGTFRSAIEKLDHLRELGITGIELMGISDFAGLRSWGYDGVLLYAPDSAYGRPEELKDLIGAAHARGMMVILDVVFNHFGPEGDYISKYFPQLCSGGHKNAWGEALNFDAKGSEQVREFIIHNALYWVEEFHIDGLRLDASHAMIDDSPRHILDELSERVHKLGSGRRIHLILEDENYVERWLIREGEDCESCYTAQWNHDMSHLLGASMTPDCNQGESDGETDRLGKAMAEGFVIGAQLNGIAAPERGVPPTAFTAAIQTHDLVGNRILGDRVYAIAPKGAIRAVAAAQMMLPQIPMLFMGDEWGASTPFPYFCDFHGELGEQVRKGRCEQLAKMHNAGPEELRNAPDPQAEETFRSAKLKWDESTEGEHAEWSEWYRRILRARLESVVPLLGGVSDACGRYTVVGPKALRIEWTLAHGTSLILQANLCAEGHDGFATTEGREVWREGWIESETRLGAWSVRCSIVESQA